MKKSVGFFLAIMMVVTFVGCNDKTDESNKIEVGLSEEKVMPIMKIDTVSTDEDAIDFATKPVSEHVSTQIASWTPNYEMPPAPYYEECKITIEDASANVLLDSAEAQVKVRGNWTTTYDKKAFRIKFAEKQQTIRLFPDSATRITLSHFWHCEGLPLGRRSPYRPRS